MQFLGTTEHTEGTERDYFLIYFKFGVFGVFGGLTFPFRFSGFGYGMIGRFTKQSTESQLMKTLPAVFLVGGILFGGLFNLGHAQGVLDPDAATNTALSDGAWSDPAIWSSGLPDADDQVLIPAGRNLSFGTTAEVATLLVAGSLTFDTQAVSALTLDTLAVDHSGELEIGRVGAPIEAGGSVTVVFRSDSDLDPASDPDLLTRGLVADGPVQIHGQAKTVHLKVAVDPLAGDSTIELGRAPDNWQVGDTIVLTGTRYSGWKWDNDIEQTRYHGTQDEVRQITAINDSSITIDQPLEYDHTTPRADLKASVANFSRNVTFSSADGAATPVHRRGHVMFRHATHFDIRYAAFDHLGRTDKSIESFDLDQLPGIEADSNVRGRYSMHFHMTGIDDPRNPAIARGNAVFDSPGWGYVHHASNAVFHDNASFDTHGAGFVAETGDEIGSWTRNIAIKAEGNSAFNPKNGVDVATFDMARTGSGYWFQGRMVRSVDNIAASVNQGYAYLHRGTRMHSFPGTAFMLPEALARGGNSSPDDPPILNFHQNESFASTVGLYVVKANPNQQHDIHSHLSRFTAWEVRAGAALEYTSHYLLEDFDIIGKTPEPFSSALFGIDFGNNTSDMVINRTHIVDMAIGISLGKGFTDESVPPEANQYVVIDATFDNVDDDYEFLDLTIDQILTSAELVPGRMEIMLNNGDPLEYLDPATTAGTGISFTGSKTDSIGISPIPAGTDNLGVPNQDMIAVCAIEGYYRAANDDPYVIIEEYFTDRATGRIHKTGLPVLLGPEVEALLGNQFHAWSDAFERGPIDLNSSPPITADDHALTAPEAEVTIAVLANDSDPDGDPLVIDGIAQPHHGLVFDNGDGTLTYRPDFDFQGQDRFRYWASDDNGNYTPATVTVTISADILFTDRFE